MSKAAPLAQWHGCEAVVLMFAVGSYVIPVLLLLVTVNVQVQPLPQQELGLSAQIVAHPWTTVPSGKVTVSVVAESA